MRLGNLDAPEKKKLIMKLRMIKCRRETMGKYSVIMMVLVAMFIAVDVNLPQNVWADEAHPWDVNDDGVVDMADVIFLGNHFGDNRVVEGDVNGDGSVNIADLILVGVHFGETYDLIGDMPQHIVGKDGVPMVLIPAGEFMMGSNEGSIDELPVHRVYLDAFYMDKYEVTNAQYATFLNESGKNTDAAGHRLLDLGDSDCLIIRDGNTYRAKVGYENHPVIEVSWYGAAAYAQFYGKRLPTEAEWERAAKGTFVGEGKYKKYVWGDEYPPPKGAGNFADESAKKKYPNWTIISGYDDGYAEAAPVGSFDPNGYGLYDMAGNVWEWCADEYSGNYYIISEGSNPKGPGVPITFENDDFTNVSTARARVVRSSGWKSGGWGLLRVTSRPYGLPDGMSGSNGFRCTRDANPLDDANTP